MKPNKDLGFCANCLGEVVERTNFGVARVEHKRRTRETVRCKHIVVVEKEGK